MSIALITGASGGIGYELAKLFARDHHNLVLVARRADKLTQVANELQAHGVTVQTICGKPSVSERQRASDAVTATTDSRSAKSFCSMERKSSAWRQNARRAP